MTNIQLGGNSNNNMTIVQYKWVLWSCVGLFFLIFSIAALILDKNGHVQRRQTTVNQIYWYNLSNGQFSSEKEYQDHQSNEMIWILERAQNEWNQN